jgi:hypothetical protein
MDRMPPASFGFDGTFSVGELAGSDLNAAARAIFVTPCRMNVSLRTLWRKAHFSGSI